MSGQRRITPEQAAVAVDHTLRVFDHIRQLLNLGNEAAVLLDLQLAGDIILLAFEVDIDLP